LIGVAVGVLKWRRARVVIFVTLVAAFPSCVTRAQDQIAGFAGFRWGATREAILARFGKPREDLRDDSLEKLSYVQGADSGYLFGLSRERGLVAGIRILPLGAGSQCLTTVQSAKEHLARQFMNLTPLETKTEDASGGSCSGFKQWDVVWRDRAGNRILLSTDVAQHRLYINYASRWSPY
jgi:hypothetical protein